MEEDLEIMRLFKAGSENAFRRIFHDHYGFLISLANRLVKDSAAAEDIVVEVFYNLWKLRSVLDENVNLHAYLSRSVRNNCLNYLKSKYKRSEYPFSNIIGNDVFEEGNYGKSSLMDPSGPLGAILGKEQIKVISEAISLLPEKCREVFRKSRFEDKTYAQISLELGISINTVKYHMKTALALLAKKLLNK